jgi:hypothetical protein
MAGTEWIYFGAAALPDGSAPLRAGQFLNIGGELRGVLEVGERCVRVAPLQDSHELSEYVWRPPQQQLGEGSYRLGGGTA